MVIVEEIVNAQFECILDSEKPLHLVGLCKVAMAASTA